MQLKSFPPVYKKELDASTNEKILEEQSRSEQEKANIRSAAKSEGEARENALTVPAVLGFVIGFFTCVANCNGYTFWDVFGWWIICTVAGVVLGLILRAASSGKNGITPENVEEHIKEEEADSSSRVKAIRREADEEYKNYLNEFESSAQNLSVQFAESSLAIEVVDWMTKGFATTIDKADRRSHVQKIEVPFVFDVYRDKITCNLGTFDFEIKRCRFLENAVEQTALARAIASTLQLNITLRFPQDPSGTENVTDLKYKYADDHIKSTIVYSAPNGNYKAVRDWSN